MVINFKFFFNKKKFNFLFFILKPFFSKALKECKLWTKANFGKIGEFRYKLYRRVVYYNIWVLTRIILVWVFKL